jgi:hypothetical protein
MEPATFRLVAQSLNQMRYSLPHLYTFKFTNSDVKWFF